jgi:hypothetical protein
MSPTLEQFRVLNGVMLSIGIVITLVRLGIRYKKSKLWWDDYWAALAAVFAFIMMVASYLHIENPIEVPRSQGVKISIYYMCIQFFYALGWASRISILFTVIRLAHDTTRRILIYIAGVFFMAWMLLLAQAFWVCERDSAWKANPVPQCILGTPIGITQAITFVLSDLVLIVAPLKLLWRVRVNFATKVRLFAVFLATVVTTGVSLYYIYAVLRIHGLEEQWAATIHDGVSLVVMNLTVIVSFLSKLGSAPEHTTDHSRGYHNNSSNSRHTGAKGYPLSNLSNIETTTGAHINVHVERVYNRDLGSQDVVSKPIGPDGKSWIDVEDGYKGEHVFDVKAATAH